MSPQPQGYAAMPRQSLPTTYDLPSEYPEEPGLPDEFHDLQPFLLSCSLSLGDYGRDNWFTGTDLNVYYSAENPRWHKRPDWFLAAGVPRLYQGHDLRLSYVVWQEGVVPQVVLELLSPSTLADDLGPFHPEGQATPEAYPPSKFQVYEQYLQVPHCIVYSRYTQELRYFRLVGGRYQEQQIATTAPQIWLADLKVGLGLWKREFQGIWREWLRWCDADGQPGAPALLPHP